MKISPSAYSKSPSQRNHLAILPLIPIEDSDWKSEQSVTHILRSTPSDADTPKYKSSCRILQGEEDCRTILKSSNMCAQWTACGRTCSSYVYPGNAHDRYSTQFIPDWSLEG